MATLTAERHLGYQGWSVIAKPVAQPRESKESLIRQLAHGVWGIGFQMGFFRPYCPQRVVSKSLSTEERVRVERDSMVS